VIRHPFLVHPSERREGTYNLNDVAVAPTGLGQLMGPVHFVLNHRFAIILGEPHKIGKCS